MALHPTRPLPNFYMQPPTARPPRTPVPSQVCACNLTPHRDHVPAQASLRIQHQQPQRVSPRLRRRSELRLGPLGRGVAAGSRPRCGLDSFSLV